MNINAIPDIFQVKLRLVIIATLMSGKKSFKQLKEITDASDGNLSVQLTKLNEKGYISINKQFVGKKPRTTYTISDKGKTEFKNYVLLLEKVIKESHQEDRE